MGKLYIVATPIGNLDDITLRALNILREVDLVAAEDTRHSRKLLSAHNISTKMIALHEHNEEHKASELLTQIEGGLSVALISDAGTPLISDPGYRIVEQARVRNIQVVPVPGACAAITALSAGGLPTDRFLFVGFMPAKQQARVSALGELQSQSATLVFYEAPRRIIDLLTDLDAVFGSQRKICIAKELTKTFENFISGTASEVRQVLLENEVLQKGEFVVLVEGFVEEQGLLIEPKILDAVRLACESMPPKKACGLVAAISGYKKNQLYQAYLDAAGTESS